MPILSPKGAPIPLALKTPFSEEEKPAATLGENSDMQTWSDYQLNTSLLVGAVCHLDRLVFHVLFDTAVLSVFQTALLSRCIVI